MTTKWFTSDLHHMHKRIVEFTNRGKDTTQAEHDDWLVEVWNSQVAAGDLVYHLGDFSFGKKYEDIASFLRKLNGQKIFIKGNHDDRKVLGSLALSGLIQSWHDYKEIKLGDKSVCLFHFPISSWHKQGYGSLHLHGHCLDGKTEILTQSGWKLFGEFTLSDMVYSYNKETKCCEISKIDQIISIDYSGNVYNFSGKSANFRVTEGHTVVGELNSEFFEKPVETLNKTTRYSLITATQDPLRKGVDLSDDEIKLYICIVADGSIKEETDLCRIRVKKEHKKKYLTALFQRLNISVNEYYKGGYISFNFYIPERLKNLKFKGLDDFLVSANRDNCVSIIDAYCNSDGHKQKNGVIIYSQKEKEIDLLQQIFVTNGFQCTKYSRFHGFSNKLQHQLSVTSKNKVNMKGGDCVVEQVENEHFWCIKTSNQNFIIRREGKVHLTGNCHGNFKDGKGKILDVGLDSAYNIYGKHQFFSEQDVLEYMQTREVSVADHHKIILLDV